MAVRMKIGEMWAIPDDNSYCLPDTTGALASFSDMLYQVSIKAMNGVAEISATFFYEDTGPISAGTGGIDIELSNNGVSASILSFTGNFIVTTPYDHIIRPDATEEKLITAIFRGVPAAAINSGLYGSNFCLVYTMDQRYGETPAYSSEPPAGSYYFTDAQGNKI